MRILTIKTQVPDSVFLKLEQAPKEMRRGLKDAVNEMARQTEEDIRIDVYQRYALKSGRFKKGNVKLQKATVSKPTAKNKDKRQSNIVKNRLSYKKKWNSKSWAGPSREGGRL